MVSRFNYTASKCCASGDGNVSDFETFTPSLLSLKMKENPIPVKDTIIILHFEYFSIKIQLSERYRKVSRFEPILDASKLLVTIPSYAQIFRQEKKEC